MRLPKDILSGNYKKPRLFLCEVGKEKICQLDTIDTEGTFKFNAFSELNFEVPRIYSDLITGETRVNPFYDKIESPRLIYLEGFGYFELQGPELISDGIKESKKCSAYSLEYVLSTKFLEDFYVNTGKVDSLEVLNAEDQNSITPITLYNSNKKLSLLHLILEKVYGWTIGHVDKQLQTLSRQFEIDRESVYDFIMNEICAKFNCYVVFDTINNVINVYAESPTAKFIGDGKGNMFTIGGAGNSNSPFSRIETVSIDGYKTTRWTYGIVNGEGKLVLEDIPEDGAIVEAVGVDSTWDTDVFVSFDNLSQEVNVHYEADSIKTVLTVTYGEDEDIRETNLGLPYLTDLSYYHTVDWMGKGLYDAYNAYLQKSNNYQSTYTHNSKEILKLNDQVYYEENRLSLEYSQASVNESTVGTYYTRETNSNGDHYYAEVSLPGDYKVGVTYYSTATTNLNEEKVRNLYSALQDYFYAHFYTDLENRTEALSKALDDIEALSDAFKFMQNYTISFLVNGLKKATTESDMDTVVYNFLGKMWNEIGRTPLSSLYLAAYKSTQEVNIKAGWSNKSNQNYGRYYPVVLFINSIETAIADREKKIANIENQKKVYQESNAKISNDLLFVNNFTDTQLFKLSAFLREDELHIDDIIETSLDTLSSSFKLKQDAMETGRIELRKLCQPQLQFSMNMANIYALPEFEPIVHQFQLGNIIKVCIRDDYLKQSRLLQVNINFEDFSDFSCEFGELTSLRTQSDIHADLLSQAISAGKSVAGSSSYWTQGADKATSTDLKIQQGLLDATTQIKAIDGTQGVVIDKYGIKLQKKNADGSIDPHQAWLVNNMILMTDDGWKTSRAGLGQFTIKDMEFYGLVAEAVLAGYIEGSTIVGSDIIGESTIRIGKMSEDDEDNVRWAFQVDQYGNVSMLGGDVQFNVTDSTGNFNTVIQDSINNVQDQIGQLENKIENIESVNANMYRVEIVSEGPTIISTKADKSILTCKVYSWDAELTDLDPSLYDWRRISASSINLIGDGQTTQFTLKSDAYKTVYPLGGVLIDGIEIDSTEYSYDENIGVIEFVTAPSENANIKIIDELDVAWHNDNSNKKSVIITHDEVDESAIFYCEVDLPE